MKQMIQVDADALRALLQALNGPGHLIRELQVTRGPLFAKENPIEILIANYNAAILKAREVVVDVTPKGEAPDNAGEHFQ